MKALISTIEPRETGYRVAQVAPDNETFPVHQSLMWVDCQDDLVADQKWYDPADQQFKDFPPPPEPPVAEPDQPTTTGTQEI